MLPLNLTRSDSARRNTFSAALAAGVGRALIAMLCLLTTGLALAADNPFLRVPIADAGAIKYNGDYYLCGYGTDGYMYSSRNLVDWGNSKLSITHVGAWALTHPTNDLYIGCSDFTYVNGVFHQYFQVDAQIGHATSTNVWGLYTEPVPATDFAVQLDPHYFRDDNGSNYFYRVEFPNGNVIFGQTMSDPATLTGSAVQMLSALSGTWEQVPSTETPINEGPFVFKYRGQYYMLYNANDTATTNYEVGCAQTNTPMGFRNSCKYPAPVLARTDVGPGEINTMGQPWVVEGPNGFEKWIGYFAIYTTDGGARFQCCDRIHFFDKTLTVDGPTDRYTTGYHPDPAKPTLLSLFNEPDGPLPATDWIPLGAGTWSVLNREATQTNQTTLSLNLVNRPAAVNYLIEANVEFTAAADGQDKVGVLAYYQDANNWMVVGIDRAANNWYADRYTAGVETLVTGALPSGWNHSVYHKIRVTRNGTQFDVRLDDMVPLGGLTPINTSFTAAGTPGVYTDHTAASFDGVIYTIGWDEYDAGVQGWGASLSGIPVTGTWNYVTNGILQTNLTGFNYTFKGDLMPQYEFETQVYQSNSVAIDGQPHTMGIRPVVIDANNYLGAEINLTNNTLFTYGMLAGVALPQQSAAVAAANNYNLRAVKLTNSVIIFVNGVQLLTVTNAFGPSQVGLVNQNVSARYNGILVYRTEPLSLPAPWQHNDIGTVGFPGYADYNDGTFVINSSGIDIWNLQDAGHFIYQPLTGDGQIIARLDSLDPTAWYAKAGPMFRENMTSNSAMVYLAINAAGDGNGDWHQFVWRATQGAGTGIITHTNDPVQILPTECWLKLARQGSTFSGYYSTNGSIWHLIGSCTVNLSSPALVGLAGNANDNTRVSGAVLDNVVVSHNLILNGDFSANAALFTTWPGYTAPTTPGNPASITSWINLNGGLVGVNGAGTGAGDPFGPTTTGGRTYAFIEGGTNGLRQYLLTLPPNTTYQLDFDVATRAGNTANYKVEVVDNAQTYFTTGTVLGNTNPFVHFTQIFSTPGTFNGIPAIKLWNLTAGDNTIDFANVSLVLLWTNSATTTTVLASSANPSTYGGAITLTATVTTTNGIPTGTVTFNDGVATLGTGTLGSGSGNTATAALTLTNLTAVTHSLTASYGGDTNFAGSISSALSQAVTTKPLTVTGVTANSKVYDGWIIATLSGTAALVGVVSGDTVTLGGTPVASFADQNIGTGKAVFVSGYTLAGVSAPNYSLTQPALSANITARPVTLSGSRVYDGTTAAAAAILTIGNNIDGAN